MNDMLVIADALLVNAPTQLSSRSLQPSRFKCCNFGHAKRMKPMSSLSVRVHARFSFVRLDQGRDDEVGDAQLLAPASGPNTSFALTHTHLLRSSCFSLLCFASFSTV